MAMKLALGQSRVGLERDQLIAVRDGKGVRVLCLRGSLWITQEQSAKDVILENGDSFVIDSPGLTLVMALRPAALRITERGEPAASVWQGLRTWLWPELRQPTVTC
jgi:hypothetical protein